MEKRISKKKYNNGVLIVCLVNKIIVYLFVRS